MRVMYSSVAIYNIPEMRETHPLPPLYEIYSLVLTSEDGKHNYHSATYWWQNQLSINEMISLSGHGAQTCFEYSILQPLNNCRWLPRQLLNIYFMARSASARTHFFHSFTKHFLFLRLFFLYMYVYFFQCRNLYPRSSESRDVST